MMQEDYVTFEQAKILKEKGFPQNGCCTYIITSERKFLINEVCWECFSKEYYICPTLSLVAKWLREEKNLYIEIILTYDNTYMSFIKQKCYQSEIFQGVETICHSHFNKSYEKALFEGINKALELI